MEKTMSENYIVINGKRTNLTDEQLKQLGIRVKPKNPMSRVEEGEKYYFVTNCLTVGSGYDEHVNTDLNKYAPGNYFNDEDFATQMALRMRLYFLLTRFTYENGWDEDLRDNMNATKFYIVYSDVDKCFKLGFTYKVRGFDVLFKTETIANRALHEIVEPFMKGHPEFRW